MTKAKSKSLINSKKLNTPKWLIFLLIGFLMIIGIFFVYRSLASGQPNLRFQILKNNACTNVVGSQDSVVHVRISRTTGNEPINNISVYVDNNPVPTTPNTINGPTTNLMIASPSLSTSPSNHRITVKGTKGTNQVEFSPYCESNGSTSNSVQVNSSNTPPADTNNNGNTESSSNNVTYWNLNQSKYFRVWEQANVYDMANSNVVKVLNYPDRIEVTRYANLNGAYFLIIKPSLSNSKNLGVFANKAYEIDSNGNPKNGLPLRNGMPLSSHRTSGGECTSSRIWYEGLNNNYVAAIQRIELHLGREVPLVTAYRTYDEQVCLYNKYNGTGQPVAAPGTSNHNKGLAVDANRDWLNSNSGLRQTFRQYNLCETVANDPGHFELCGSFK